LISIDWLDFGVLTVLTIGYWYYRVSVSSVAGHVSLRGDTLGA